MKYVVIGAMEEEISLIKEQLADAQETKLSYLTVFKGNIKEHEIFLVQSGIGKVASAGATALLIKEFQPDYVINTGSAGGFDPDLNVGDIVIGEKLLHHDVDVSHFGYKLGQVPQMPEYYMSDAKLVEKAMHFIDSLPDVQTKQGLICTGDSFIGSDDIAASIKVKFPDMKAVEMEGAAIAQMCFLMNTPFIVIRSLSDIAGKTSTVSFEQYLALAAKNSAKLVLNIIR